jgi:hypothetical protein
MSNLCRENPISSSVLPRRLFLFTAASGTIIPTAAGPSFRKPTNAFGRKKLKEIENATLEMRASYERMAGMLLQFGSATSGISNAFLTG